MRKVLNKQKASVNGLQNQFFHKYHARPMLQEWRDYCTKIVKIERITRLNLTFNCFQDMLAVIAQEKNVTKVHRERSLKFKVIFLLKKRACDRKRRRAISAIVTERYTRKMMTNVYQAL